MKENLQDDKLNKFEFCKTQMIMIFREKSLKHRKLNLIRY
jgi:hypothetical protein